MAKALRASEGGPMGGQPFEVGDWVRPTGNYLDEQLGEHATMDRQKITSVWKVGFSQCSSGWLVKTTKYSGWVDSDWFKRCE